MSLDYIKNQRGLPFVEKGMRVEVNGRRGNIKGENASGNLNIVFDGEKKNSNCHPHWRIKYFNGDGSLIKEFGE